MSWFGSGRGGWQRAFWLPLVLGIGIGVLIFGLPHSIWGGGQQDTRGGFAAGANTAGAPQQGQQVAPQTGANTRGFRQRGQQVAPQAGANASGSPQQGQQVAPQAGVGQTDPNVGTAQNTPGTNVVPSGQQRGFGHGRDMGRRHELFDFHFGGLGLLLPLLLIGTGAWLLSGRRGPGNWGGPTGPHAGQPGTSAKPAATVDEPQAVDHPAPPVTGETRRL